MSAPRACSTCASYPCGEVHGGPTVQQERGHVHVAIVSSDVQRGESTLEETGRAEGEESDIKGAFGTISMHLEHHRWKR